MSNLQTGWVEEARGSQAGRARRRQTSLVRRLGLAALGILPWCGAAEDTASPPAGPESPPAWHALTFRWENDAVAETDENYSNGISLSYQHSGRGLLGGVWRWFGVEDAVFSSDYSLGQIMVTPRDTDRPVPDPEDRPYVGMLYAALSTQVRLGNQFHGLKFVTGVVGPWSQAEEVQAWFHQVIGSGKARGWAHQLKNEPIFNLVYEHRRKFPLLDPESDWGVDLIPVGGAMLGNVLVQAQVGAQLRVGYHAPDDFGTTIIRGFGTLPFSRPPANGGRVPRWGVYAFAGASGVAVARNLSLDGNTFEDSPSVDKQPFFAAGETGLVLWTRRVQVAASFVWWGREFENQARASRFGTLAITIPF